MKKKKISVEQLREKVEALLCERGFNKSYGNIMWLDIADRETYQGVYNYLIKYPEQSAIKILRMNEEARVNYCVYMGH